MIEALNPYWPILALHVAVFAAFWLLPMRIVQHVPQPAAWNAASAVVMIAASLAFLWLAWTGVSRAPVPG